MLKSERKAPSRLVAANGVVLRPVGAPRSAMEVVVKKVLGYERDEKAGWAVLREVEISGTVQELCRLVFPTEGGIAALRKFIADASTTPRLGTD